MKEYNVEIQFRGIRFPAQLRDKRRTVAMAVTVHRMRYNKVTDAIIGIGERKVAKDEYPVTYDIHMEDVRLNRDNVEERFRNAYLSLVQYYMNRVIVKIVGLPKEINMDTFIVGPENHSGSREKTIKQLIMEDATYVKENGVNYNNPVKQLQKVVEGRGWKVTGRK